MDKLGIALIGALFALLLLLGIVAVKSMDNEHELAMAKVQHSTQCLEEMK